MAQITPIDQLVSKSWLFAHIDPNQTGDINYVAGVLQNLFLGVYQDPAWGDALNEKYKEPVHCLNAIKTKKELAEKCRNSMKSKKWAPVFEWLREEWLEENKTSQPTGELGLDSSKYAWDIEFVGDAHKQLMIEMEKAATGGFYSTITPIVQSSGMGKSRTVDELAKTIFTIPICLREPRELGYPCCDEPLYKYFQSAFNKAHDPRRVCIDILRSIIREVINILKSERIKGDIVGKWYERLKPCDGAPSRTRIKLYNDAVKNFTHSADTSTAQANVVKEFKELAKLIPPRSSSIRAIVYIDECHYLYKINTEVDEINYNALNDMLHAIELCGREGLFGITLSTNSSFRAVSPRADEFRSSRENPSKATPGDLNKRPVPFTLLPFDTWNGTAIIKEDQYSLRDVCTIKFASRHGRNLWWTRLMNPKTSDSMSSTLVSYAARKLTLTKPGSPLSDEAKIAALIARLAVRFNTSLESVHSLQDKLVASHMSVAYHVPAHKNYMHSGYPSEPILMEGAAFVWDKNKNNYPEFNPLETLRDTFTNGFLAKGERGELVGRYLCLRAQDICVQNQHTTNLIGNTDSYGKAVPLNLFFQTLFGPRWEDIRRSKARNRKGGVFLETACKDKYVRFTHFAKAGDASALSTAAAWKALARGNAWQFYDRQEGVDLGIPVFMGKPDDPLGRQAVTWLLIQIKNSSRMQSVHFSAETLGIFSDRKPINKTYYFVLVFHLSVKASAPRARAPLKAAATKKKGKTSRNNRPPSPEKVGGVQNKGIADGKDPADDRDPKRAGDPCYWIEVVGCSPNVFNPEIVPESARSTFRELLASRDILDEVTDEDSKHAQAKKQAILKLKPYFLAGSASYGWAEDDNKTRYSPGTNGYGDEGLEMVNAVSEVEGEAVEAEESDEE